MTLDEEILEEARTVNARLIDLRRDEERAQADLHHAIRRLHAAGGTLREIADELGLSHQRVHQIVGKDVEAPEPRRSRPAHRRGFGGPMVRFTHLARAAVEGAVAAAEEAGHPWVGTEHLLLGLAQAERGGAAGVLRDAGLDPGRVHEALLAAVEPGKPRARLPLTRRLKLALEGALREASRLGSRRIGTEHLLLALVDDADSGAARMLDGLGADREDLRRRTFEALG